VKLDHSTSLALHIQTIIIRNLFNNGNPSAKAAFQGAVLLVI
jgi:hypothetical protein